ncbi:regulatory-associated protein of mtor [Anaeramoeba ignava]|uniref:Regulatory-associated protein of mtor n=1 Tax=Anaeramoeba ignava TaxID=1746090 RepID=A0A9Q0LW90_ANAIG|nr:regulatory-associated protein of mtor [Anaeramoeba ignava]
MFPSFENKGNIADSNSVFDWNPNNGIVSGFGANRMIRLWNVETENQLQTLPTNSERGLSCLNHDPKILIFYLVDLIMEKLLVYDIRVKPAMSLVQCLTEHKNQIINFKKQFDSEEVLISGSVQGDVKFWDLRKPYALKTLTPYQGLMTALEIHDYCPLIACGSNNHSVKIFNTNGDLLNIIGYYDSFIVQKLGMVHAVSFHPYQIYLAATADSLISVFIPSYLKN